MPPHRKMSHGGEARCWLGDEAVGTQPDSSRSPFRTTESSWLSEASRNISRSSFAGSGPWYWGGPLLRFPVPVARAHFAAFATVSSVGLNWKSMRSKGAPGWDSEPSREGSYSCRYACSNFVGAEPEGVELLTESIATATVVSLSSRWPR